MKGTPITLTIKHATGRKTELRRQVQATKYGPVAVFDADGCTVIAHAASGTALLTVPNRLEAARAAESLLALVNDWGHRYDGRHVVFSPSLVSAVATLR